MKQTIFFVCGAAALLLAGCAKAPEEKAPQGRVVTISASIDSDDETKATVGDDGSFSWASGDQIGVWTSNGVTPKFTRFDLKGGEAGKTTAEFVGTLDDGYDVVPGPVVYPYRAGHSYNPATQELTYNQPSAMTFEGGDATKSHMAAMYSGSGTISFKHLSGLIRFTVFNVPSTAAYIRLRTNDKKTYGDFVVDMSAATPQIVAPAASSNQDFNLNFSSSPVDAVGKMYVASFPVPTGTYGYLRVSAQSKEDMIGYKEKNSSTTISRAQMINMPEVTINTVELSDSEDNAVRANMNSGYSNTEGTVLSVVSNSSWKSVMDASNYALKVDASAQDTSNPEAYKGGYFLIKTQNSDYSTGFREGTKAFAVKVRYENSTDAAIYYPRAYCNGATGESAKRLPNRINGVEFGGTAENWEELINPDDWNVLQWTCVNTGTWRVEITPFQTITGTNATDGSRIMYFDDFRFLK